jgi:short-subunit dehydrogenase
MTKLAGKIIWITGASSGLGEALSIEAAQKGAKVIISARSVDKLEALKKQLDNISPGCAIVLPMDITKKEEIISCAQKVKETTGKVDILINNAGVSQRSLAIETPVEVDRMIFEIDFFGVITLTKILLPLMMSGDGGHLVVISSMAGLYGFPMRSAYSAAKHALCGFFETLSLELWHSNIKVTMVCPGRINTNISINSLNQRGENYGIMDAGQEKGLTAEKTARKIIRAIEHNKKQLLIGFKETFLYYVKKFIPVFYYYIARKASAT